MYNDVEWSDILFWAIISAFLIGILIFGAGTSNKNSQYEWGDANGNHGIAADCYTSKGNLICRTDNEYRQVIYYKKISK